MKILFYVFGFPIHFFGAMIAIGMLVGMYAAYLEVKRKKLDIDNGFDIVMYSIIAAIVGARLFYIIFYDLSYYLENPMEIIRIYEGGLSIHGGLLSAFIVVSLYIRKNKINFFQYADAIAPAIILGQAIGRVGCDVFGKVMSSPLPWGIQHQGQIFHPAQVYEFLLNYLVFFILWRKRKSIQYDGQIFVWYIILFSINRGVVEIFRINPSIIGGFSIAHLLSLLFIIGGFALMFFAKKKKDNTLPDSLRGNVESKFDLIKDIAITLVLIVVSMVVFYAVQS
jgi:phosphatidylglycerol:prolipoprotein diacylglycerol transferase